MALSGRSMTLEVVVDCDLRCHIMSPMWRQAA